MVTSNASSKLLDDSHMNRNSYSLNSDCFIFSSTLHLICAKTTEKFNQPDPPRNFALKEVHQGMIEFRNDCLSADILLQQFQTLQNNVLRSVVSIEL